MKYYNYKRGLPLSIANKIYKTGQTRGAEKDDIYQNRVLRNSTVLIPYDSWNDGSIIPSNGFENGYIVLICPDEYFSLKDHLDSKLKLGDNLLVYYETRSEWNTYTPSKYGWTYAISRISPLKGQYVARIPDTIKSSDKAIRDGFISEETGGQGAGIRVYEYASKSTIEKAYYQLAYLAWHTEGIIELAKREGIEEPEKYKKNVENYCEEFNLSDINLLEHNRLIINGKTVCPLCLAPIKAAELASKAEQAEGRNTPDLTVTQANLFHNKELRTGEYNHKLYNLGWGHYHCNTVTRDIGISNTLKWMKRVIINNSCDIKKKQAE